MDIQNKINITSTNGSGIYKISFNGSSKFYIGSAVNLNKRRINHLSDLRNERHPNKIMQRMFNKHGEMNFIFDVIENVSSEHNLINREQFYIDTLMPTINILKIANSALGSKHTDETINKLKKIARERANDSEWISKVEGTWFRKGKMNLSAEQIERYKNHGAISFKDKKHTEKTRLLMSEKAKKRLIHNTQNLISAPLKKRIISIKNGEKTVFNSISDFEKSLGMNGYNGSLRRKLLNNGSHFLKKYDTLVSYV